jgi:hypothetical protein
MVHRSEVELSIWQEFSVRAGTLAHAPLPSPTHLFALADRPLSAAITIGFGRFTSFDPFHPHAYKDSANAGFN